jgi:hypothetical protein
MKISFTIADASVKLPNFCLINGLNAAKKSFVFYSKEKTYLLCRHRNICIGIGITSSWSDDEQDLCVISR